MTPAPASPIATQQPVEGRRSVRIEHVGEGRDRLAFSCPRRPGHECSVLLKPWPIIAASTWNWDGNEQAPTLTPSVNCVGGCGWHGFIQNGRLTNAE